MNSIFKNIAALLLFVAGSINLAQAQAVIFPQQQQPEAAVGSFDGNSTYTLSNQLFTAKFVKDGNTLTFAGCPEMGLQAGTDLFKITLGDGTVVTDKQMTLGNVELITLTGDKAAVKGSHRFNGYELKANYTYNQMTLVWSAVLRDGSHYLRTKLDVTASQDVAMKSLTPMAYQVDKSVGGLLETVGNTRGAILASDKLFAGLETPMGINTVSQKGKSSDAASAFTVKEWQKNSFKAAQTVPDAILKLVTLDKGQAITAKNVKVMTAQIKAEQGYDYDVTFTFKPESGQKRLNMVGVDVIDEKGSVMASDYHVGYAGNAKHDNVYTLSMKRSGTFTIRYFVETLTEFIDSKGTLSYTKSAANSAQTVEGLWSRNTTLEADKHWNVSSVIGIIAPKQARRSVLAYSERERAVPWRPMPIYNSWYELNIGRNDAPKPEDNMHTEYTAPILEAWKTNLFDKYGVGIKSFVWDDGWDNYKTWECHSRFNFTEPTQTAESMGAGTGVWLGPVGGYGESGKARRNNWLLKGGMRLSNPKYYKVFYAAVTNFVNNYNGNFFKLDGISDLVTAFGPKDSPTGEEDAEQIIALESHIRSLKSDIFLNTSVGTWASPFWFRYTDAIWRQDQDYGEAGDNSSDREKWITYRDRLVYQHFVKESPLCPINTMMVHGVILSEHGNVSKDMTRDGIIREIHCAFASGNAMQELYCDYELLNKHELWGVLAECINWQQKNADVLPDIHWVGGSPWDGRNENVYGWASWNGENATFALRNGDTKTKTFTTTLREALEIPDYVSEGTTITFEPSFKEQNALQGLTTGKPIGIDERLELTLPASSAYAFDGVQDQIVTPDPEPQPEEKTIVVNIKPENKYGTCILPFDAALPASLKAYSCSASEGDLLILNEESALAANTPYILFAEQGAHETFKGKVDPAVTETAFTRGYLTGVLVDTEVAAGTNSYVLQNQGKGVRFYWVNSTKTIPAYRSYLTMPSNSVKSYRFGGDLTGIDGILFEQSYYPVFDLAGRRVMKTVPGHIYIQNGKKFLAK